jgi:hypothetical protein
LQDLLKFTQTVIFGLKVHHLATLDTFAAHHFICGIPKKPLVCMAEKAHGLRSQLYNIGTSTETWMSTNQQLTQHGFM